MVRLRQQNSSFLLLEASRIKRKIDGNSYLINRNFGRGYCYAEKVELFFKHVIGSFIGVFIGFGIYKFWHFKTYPNLYAMQSAPWYTELLLDGAMVAVVVVVCIVLKLVIWRKLKP